jgi:Bcr/CflA subfamily drug resistance transporter
MLAENKVFPKLPSILLIICLIGLPQISETIYSPALPDITYSLATSSNLVQWTLSVYFLGFALGVSLWGGLSDKMGRRFCMLLGLGMYLVMSFFCSITHSIYTLLMARLVQAFGISVGSVITQTIIRDCYKGVERNKIFSVVGMAIALAPALGPLLGGYLTQYFSWRANFICMTTMGFMLMIYSYYRLPETRAYSILNLPPDRVKTSIWQLTKQMLKDKHIMASAILVGGFNGILFSYYSEGPYIFIELFHLDPKQYGMLGIIMALGVCLGSLISHRINQYVNVIKLIQFLCLTLILLMLAFLISVFFKFINPGSAYLGIFLIMSFMMLFYIIFGICIPNILSKALVKYQSYVGTASSIFGFIYYLWVAIFVFGMGAFLSHSLIIMPVYFFMISLFMFMSSQFLCH